MGSYVVENRINELFALAGIRGNLGIKVVLDSMGGYKSYLLNDFDEPPVKIVVLNDEKEEKVFRMFRYPDLECDEIKKYVIGRINRAFTVQRMLDKGMTREEISIIDSTLLDDYDFKEKYFKDAHSLHSIRENLRYKYKDLLIEKAKELLSMKPSEPEHVEKSTSEVEVMPSMPMPKPIYKSKTVIVNILIALIVNILTMYGINLTPQDVANIFLTLNIILRFITKQPISLWR